jgi:hypothetical protein
MAVDRPEAIDPHPKGCNEVEGGQGEAFLFREEWARQRPGEENETGRCGRESETSAATSACGQTCHIEDAVGRPVGTSGHHGGCYHRRFYETAVGRRRDLARLYDNRTIVRE